MGDFYTERILPPYLEEMIDKSVIQDFVSVNKLTPEDRQNDMFKAIKFSFKSSHIEIVYERNRAC